MFKWFKDKKRFKLSKKCFKQLIVGGSSYSICGDGIGTELKLLGNPPSKKDLAGELIILRKEVWDDIGSYSAIIVRKNNIDILVFEIYEYPSGQKEFFADGDWLDSLVMNIKL